MRDNRGTQAASAHQIPEKEHTQFISSGIAPASLASQAGPAGCKRGPTVPLSRLRILGINKTSISISLQSPHVSSFPVSTGSCIHDVLAGNAGGLALARLSFATLPVGYLCNLCTLPLGHLC
mmetsp:Transcript_48625/g.81732  ORF Transcript_48625/g.81732 Transcript_48625/m.81732 type:complete len:122 (+) Transcript_48625:2333-2698(+)